MKRRPTRSTRTTHSFPTRRSSDLRHPDGSTRYFRINGRPYFAADGSFLGYRGTGTDTTFEVTARREIEARIEQIGRAHSELQSLMRTSYAVFCLKKKNHNKRTIQST